MVRQPFKPRFLIFSLIPAFALAGTLELAAYFALHLLGPGEAPVQTRAVLSRSCKRERQWDRGFLRVAALRERITICCLRPYQKS